MKFKEMRIGFSFLWTRREARLLPFTWFFAALVGVRALAPVSSLETGYCMAPGRQAGDACSMRGRVKR